MSTSVPRFSGGLIVLDDEPPSRAGILDRGLSLVIAVVLSAVIVGTVVASLVQIDVSVSATGELEPLQVWTVRAPQSGSIAAVTVHAGDVLANQQPLFVIDSSTHADDVRELKATMQAASIEDVRYRALRPLDVDAAEQRVGLAASSVTRARAHLRSTMVEIGMNPYSDSLRMPAEGQNVALDIARADLQQAERELRLAQLAHERLVADSLDVAKNKVLIQRSASALALAQQRLSQSLVRSPARGVLLTERVEQMAGRFITNGEAVLEIGSLGGWRAHVLVSEADVHRVRPGQLAEVKFAATGREHPRPSRGHVVEVGAQPWRTGIPANNAGLSITESQPKYRVVLEMDSTDRPAAAYRRGFTVQTRIHVGRLSALRAVSYRIFGGEPGT